VAGHKRERKGKGEKKTREKQEKVRESFETCKIYNLRTLH
jgi:hypothetical protein